MVLKGHMTLIASGTAVFVNPTGNPGMATGGTGDVLTGLIAGLLAQGLDALDAAVLARLSARPGGGPRRHPAGGGLAGRRRPDRDPPRRLRRPAGGG